jgi:hypothetical protein
MDDEATNHKPVTLGIDPGEKSEATTVLTKVSGVDSTPGQVSTMWAGTPRSSDDIFAEIVKTYTEMSLSAATTAESISGLAGSLGESGHPAPASTQIPADEDVERPSATGARLSMIPGIKPFKVKISFPLIPEDLIGGLSWDVGKVSKPTVHYDSDSAPRRLNVEEVKTMNRRKGLEHSRRRAKPQDSRQMLYTCRTVRTRSGSSEAWVRTPVDLSTESGTWLEPTPREAMKAPSRDPPRTLAA